jgi:hypothetical protein
VSAVQRQHLRVQVAAVRVRGVELEYQGKKTITPDKYLLIRLQVSLEGAAFQQLPYEPWADLAGAPSKHPPTLTDHAGRAYTQKTFAAGRNVVGRTGRGYLTPGRQVHEVLVYPAPPGPVAYLRLTLPAAALGGEGEFRFQIPRSMIEFS